MKTITKSGVKMSEKKYSKPFGNLNSMKQTFFKDNDGMLAMADNMADILLSQPERTNCKICGTKLPGVFFTSHKIGYKKCDVCGHLNSECIDNDEFASKVYVEDDYSKNYSAKDKESYRKRLESIYTPKAQYLHDCLTKDGVDEINILDIGAGCGYFSLAAKELGMNAKGIEVSPSEVEYGNKMAGEDILTRVGLTDSIDYIKNTDCNVISAIGVLEHLTHLDENIDAIKQNSNIQYVYASVPMFSFSCAFEVANQECYNRHMGGTHTHLFTNESIRYMAEKMGFSVEYEWRFGSDINDLYRFLRVSIEKNGSAEFADYFAEKFVPLLDRLQNVLDESDFSSELHFILKRK